MEAQTSTDKFVVQTKVRGQMSLQKMYVSVMSQQAITCRVILFLKYVKTSTTYLM